MLNYMSIGLGQPREKTRIQLMERMVQPVGKPPEVGSAPDNVGKDVLDGKNTDRTNSNKTEPENCMREAI